MKNNEQVLIQNEIQQLRSNIDNLLHSVENARVKAIPLTREMTERPKSFSFFGFIKLFLSRYGSISIRRFENRIDTFLKRGIFMFALSQLSLVIGVAGAGFCVWAGYVTLRGILGVNQALLLVGVILIVLSAAGVFVAERKLRIEN